MNPIQKLGKLLGYLRCFQCFHAEAMVRREGRNVKASVKGSARGAFRFRMFERQLTLAGSDFMLRALGFTLSGIRFGLGADANPDALIGERRG